MVFRKSALKIGLIGLLLLGLVGGEQAVAPKTMRAAEGPGYYDGSVEHENPFPEIFRSEEIENAGGGGRSTSYTNIA